jgi:hypothetical protein
MHGKFKQAQMGTFSNKQVWVVIASKIKMLLSLFDD